MKFFQWLVIVMALASTQARAQHISSTSPPLPLPYVYCASPPYNVTAVGAVDQTAKIQSCLTAATGGTAVLPLGKLVINGTGISVPALTGLIGQGFSGAYNTGSTVPTGGTVLYSPFASYASGTNPVISLGGQNWLSYFTLYGAGNGAGSSTSRPGVLFAANANVYIDHVGIFNNSVGIQFAYHDIGWVTNSEINENQYGIQNPVDAHFEGDNFAGNGVDVYCGGCASNLFIGNRFEYNSNGPSIQTYGVTATAATNNTTASGNASLHFASAPGAAVQGYYILDLTTPTAIPACTYVTTASPATTIVMSANAAGSGVGNGDTIEFYNPNATYLNFSGNQWDASSGASLQLDYAAHVSVDGSNIFRGSGVNATANTSADTFIEISHSNSISVVGANMYANPPSGGSPYGPSWGFWDGSSNCNSTLQTNTIVYNPVDGTHGGGINTTATFSNFNTQNTIHAANPYVKGQP